MKIHLFMGTHLPEIAECLRFLAGIEPGSAGARIFVPGDLPWPDSAGGAPAVTAYAPDGAGLEFPVDDEARAFVVVDPRQSPVPQLEGIAAILQEAGLEPEGIVTCVDCAAAESAPRLRAWLEACTYYSDAVLLGNRGGASKAFVHDFQKHYEKLCYPCLFFLLKGPGHPSHPLEILYPHARRISQLFDLPEEGVAPAPADLIIEASCDLDLEEPEADPYRPLDEAAPPTPEIPDVTQWIVTAAQQPGE